MRWLGWTTAVVVAALVVAELVAPTFAARQVEESVASETRGALQVAADVSGPPLVVPVLAGGAVDTVAMDVLAIAGREPFADIGIEIRGARLDRSRLVRGDVVVNHVDDVVLTMVVDLRGAVPEALREVASRLADASLDLLVNLAGQALGLAFEDGDLVVGGVLAVPTGGCETSTAELLLTVTCQLPELPAVLLRSLTEG